MIDVTRRRTLRIRIPEGIEFSRPIASPAIRLLATTIDYSIILLAIEIIGVPLTLLGFISSDIAVALTLVSSFLLGVGYSIWFEWRNRGQTIGKRVLKIQVVSADGTKLVFSQIVMRNLLRVVDQLPLFFGVGGVVALIDRQGRRLGDLVGGTVVVFIQSVHRPTLNLLEGEKYNSLRERKALVGRLRQEISPALADLALQAIERRHQLKSNARIELFDDLATHFRSLANVPDGLFNGISNEQFVVNVADVIFRADSEVSGFPTETESPS